MKTTNTSRIITNPDVSDKTKMAYVRVSSLEQSEARQLEALKSYDIYKIFVEKASAKDTDRPILKQLLEFVREGDTIYIKDFSRLARSTKDLLSISEELDSRGIKLVSLNENLDTGTSTGKLMLTMLAAIYEFERANLLERQREGCLLAKQAGKYKGRRKIERPESWNEVYDLYKTREITAQAAMTKLGLKRNTFYKFIKEFDNKSE
jgi:DNA invertase Pin-like site-specific DNA recombinase